ncbi:MAG: hypothetical protein ACXAC2_05795 [Candidatus Kariarchaeaceae archaeon]|jgi:predicted O-methyltransferase YrrM
MGENELFQINLIRAIRELKKRFPNEPLNCLETGTLRNLAHKHNSTLHISNTLDDDDILTSVDINPEYIQVSKDACAHNKNIRWVTDDSINWLKKIEYIDPVTLDYEKKYHFVFLDTANCADHIFKEFTLVVPHMITNGILIIDDAGINMNGSKNVNTTKVKGHRVASFLLHLGLTDFIRRSPIGTQIWIDANDANLKIIMLGLFG